MIRQAISYLRGATSSAILIGVAVIAAVFIIIAAGTGSNPISALGLSSDPDPVLVTADTVAQNEDDLDAEEERRVASDSAVDPRVVAVRRAARSRAADRRRRARNANRRRARPQAPVSQPVSGPTGTIINDGGGGSDGGSRPATQPDRGSQPGGGAGGGSVGGGGGSGGAGGGGGGEIIRDGSSGGGGNGSGSGSGGSGGGESTPGSGGSGSNRSLAGGVNNTVDALDETLGGTLGKTGVSDTVKQTTEALLGQDSTVGKTVDGVTKGLGRLLGGKK